MAGWSFRSDGGLRSGFVTFAGGESREKFLAELSRSAPDIAAHCMPSRIGSRLVVRDLSAAEIGQLKALLDNRGQWYDDVQFAVPDPGQDRTRGGASG